MQALIRQNLNPITHSLLTHNHSLLTHTGFKISKTNHHAIKAISSNAQPHSILSEENSPIDHFSNRELENFVDDKQKSSENTKKDFPVTVLKPDIYKQSSEPNSDKSAGIADFILDNVNKINTFAARLFNFLFHFIWPFQKKSAQELEKNSHSLLRRILQNGLDLPDCPPVKIKEPDSPPLPIHTAITAIEYGINFGLVPYQISQNYSQNLLTTIVTTNVMQGIVSGCCWNVSNKSILKKYDLISELDTTDIVIYQSSVALFAHGINLLPFQKMQWPLHFAVAVISTLPPIQNAIKRSTYGQRIHTEAHRLVAKSRETVENSLSFVFTKAIKYSLKKNTHYADHLSAALTQELSEQLPLPSTILTNPILNNITDAVLDHHITDLLAKEVPVMINKMSKNLAHKALDSAVSYTKNSFKIYFCNHTLSATLHSHPVLTSISLIAQGGSNQNLRELILRVSGAIVMVFTGSTFWPMLMIHTPQFLEYVINLRGKHLKKEGILEDPVIQLVKNLFSSLQRLLDKKDKKSQPVLLQEIQPSYSTSTTSLRDCPSPSKQTQNRDFNNSVSTILTSFSNYFFLKEDCNPLPKKMSALTPSLLNLDRSHAVGLSFSRNTYSRNSEF